MSYMKRFAANFFTAQRGTAAMPCRSGYSVHQFLVLWLTHLVLASQTSLSYINVSVDFIHGLDGRKTFLHQGYCPSFLQYLVSTPMPLLGPLTSYCPMPMLRPQCSWRHLVAISVVPVISLQLPQLHLEFFSALLRGHWSPRARLQIFFLLPRWDHQWTFHHLPAMSLPACSRALPPAFNRAAYLLAVLLLACRVAVVCHIVGAASLLLPPWPTSMSLACLYAVSLPLHQLLLHRSS